MATTPAPQATHPDKGPQLARPLAVLLGMIVVIVALFWAGVHNLRARRTAMEDNHVELIPATADNGADVAMPDAQGANLIGKAAPAFTLPGVDGKKISLAEYKGHPVIVNFWATWCGPCKLEMPWFQQFYSKYKPQGLVILGLSQDDGARPDDLIAAAKKIGVSYPILMPSDDVAKAYGGVEYLPETFYIDKAGKVVAVTAGAPTKDEMEAKIQQTIAAGGA